MSETVLYVAAVAAIIFKENRILAMKRSLKKDAGPGLWETISGRINADEDPLEAVQREIEEECGLNVAVDPRPVTAYHATRMGHPMIVILYRAEYISGEVVQSAEHDDHAWLTPEQFAEISTIKKLVDVVQNIPALPPFRHPDKD